MKSLKILGSFGILLFFVACAGSGPNGFTEVKERLPEMGPKAGRIYIYTPIRTFFLDFVPPVLVNGKKVGVSRSGSFLVVDEPAGEYTVTVGNEKIFSDSGGQIKSEPATISLEVGETAYIRFYAVNSEYFIQMKSIPEDAVNGERDLKTLSYQGGNVKPAEK